jgi:hypothetical protein
MIYLGMTFYEFTETKLEEQERGAKKPKKQKYIITQITLAVASTKLCYYQPDTNQFIKIIPYTSLKRFVCFFSFYTFFTKIP